MERYVTTTYFLKNHKGWNLLHVKHMSLKETLGTSILEICIAVHMDFRRLKSTELTF